jgi:hypothetical protein
VSFKSSHLVNVIEVEQTRPSTAVFPTLQDFRLHFVGIDMRRNQPQLMRVRVPAVLAQRQFK